MNHDGLDPSEPGPAARAKVLTATLGVVRRRRHARRALAALAATALFAAGFATRALIPAAGAAPVQRGSSVASTAAVPPPAPESPRALEAKAVAAPSQNERATLLRAAGDRYLTDQSDVEAALRCYREVLKLASSEERTRFDPSDNWLLAALKRGSD